MARGDPTWGKTDVTWPDDPRSRYLTAPENWLYMVVRLAAIAEHTNVLPRAYHGSYFVSRAGVKRQTWENLLRRSSEIDSERPIIFLNEDGRICLPSLGKQHAKLDWKTDRAGPPPSPYGADIGPVALTRARSRARSRPTDQPTERFPPEGGSQKAASAAPLSEAQKNFVLLWNETAEKTNGKVPVIKRLGKKREGLLAARLRDNGWGDDYPKALEKIPGSSFLQGDNERNWIANAEWFLRPGVMEKVLEGNYRGRKGQAKGGCSGGRSGSGGDRSFGTAEEQEGKFHGR